MLSTRISATRGELAFEVSAARRSAPTSTIADRWLASSFEEGNVTAGVAQRHWHEL
jgi:hypothetical protein